VANGDSRGKRPLSGGSNRIEKLSVLTGGRTARKLQTGKCILGQVSDIIGTAWRTGNYNRLQGGTGLNSEGNHMYSKHAEEKQCEGLSRKTSVNIEGVQQDSRNFGKGEQVSDHGRKTGLKMGKEGLFWLGEARHAGGTQNEIRGANSAWLTGQGKPQREPKKTTAGCRANTLRSCLDTFIRKRRKPV